MQIHISTTGGQEGPFTIDQINQKVLEGAITIPTTMAWYEGAATWIPLNQVPGITQATSPVPPVPPAPPAPPAQGDATGGIIPYKNPHALVSYYLGIFGLFPALGFFLAIPAVIFGISGLRRYRENPIIKGKVHAWIGISLGWLSIGCHILVIILIILASK